MITVARFHSFIAKWALISFGPYRGSGRSISLAHIPSLLRLVCIDDLYIQMGCSAMRRAVKIRAVICDFFFTSDKL